LAAPELIDRRLGFGKYFPACRDKQSSSMST
jgi:hypothetical protein